MQCSTAVRCGLLDARARDIDLWEARAEGREGVGEVGGSVRLSPINADRVENRQTSGGVTSGGGMLSHTDRPPSAVDRLTF